jgi:hypothetical protein
MRLAARSIESEVFLAADSLMASRNALFSMAFEAG